MGLIEVYSPDVALQFPSTTCEVYSENWEFFIMNRLTEDLHRSRFGKGAVLRYVNPVYIQRNSLASYCLCCLF